MSERPTRDGTSHGDGADPREERLRVLCAAAYDAVRPSETLRQRVAVAILQPEASPRQFAGWRPRRIVWGLAAAVFLVALPGSLERRERSGRDEIAGRAPAVETAAAKAQSRHPPSVGTRTRAKIPVREGGVRAFVARGFNRRGKEPASPTRSFPSVPRRAILDDIAAMNRPPEAAVRDWTALRPDEWAAFEARVRGAVRVRDDFVTVPFPRIASTADRQIAEAVESYKREAAVVDPRLAREVTLQLKATALSDLCEHLRNETGIRLVAGPSVADEKVTLLCKRQPLRDVMRQLSRPFGYTWSRSTRNGAYHYELMQDLRGQLLEEELRNRDRHGALLDLERELQRYRPYLDLTPDQALARAKTAAPAEKTLLEPLSEYGWGPIQIYFRLSARDLAALRAGQSLTFDTEPRSAGDQRLPPDLARGVLQSFRGWKVVKQGDRYRPAFEVPGAEAEAVLVSTLTEARVTVRLAFRQSELGRTALWGQSSWSLGGGGGAVARHPAEGSSPAVVDPGNAALNKAFLRDPALRARVTVRPQPSCVLSPGPNDAPGGPPAPRVTTADVLAALHEATGLPIVSDYYSRLYPPSEVTASNQPLFDALCRLADRIRLRWRWDKNADGAGGTWLQFRSTSYYDDRLKEVPNRLLSRWAEARRRQGSLSLDHVTEIAQLSDDQLNAEGTAEAARACSGLLEWDLARSRQLRDHLRFLAGFTPAQRQEAMSSAGLLFSRMPLAQQQRYLSFALNPEDGGLQSLEEMSGATLRVEYTHPGGFQWGDAGHPGLGRYTRWVIPLSPGPQGGRVPRPVVRERTREAALQAVRRVDPRLREALLEATRRVDTSVSASLPAVEEGELFPTRLDLAIVYIPGASNARQLQVWTAYASYDAHPP